MAYPPSTPASDKTNDTLTRDDHAPHHNQLALAIGDMVTELGSDPKGPDADVTARLDRLDEESDPALVEAIQQGDADYLDRKLFAWRKALANAATTRAVILALGDSRVEGAGLDTIEERWLNLLQGHLRDRYNSLDTGRGYIPASYTAYMALDEDPTTSGTVAFRDTEGLGLRAMALSSTGPGTVTFELHGTDMILCYAGINGGGQSEYRVNGGGWATINHNNGAAGFDFREEQEFVYLGPEDDYTVEWRWKAQGTGIAPTPVIEGIIEINGDEAAAGSGSDFAGISVLDSGHAGATAADYIAASSDHLVTQWVSDNNATLAIIDLGTNEWQASEHATITSDVATYKANLETLIGLLRSGNSDIEVILLGGWTPAGTLGTGSPDDWELFVAAQYEIAAADPLTSVFDMRRFLPEPYSGGDDSFYDFLAIHPTAAGHAAIASALADHLSLPTGGAWSSPADLVPDDGQDPAAPTSLVVTAAPLGLSVAWAANTEVDMVDGFGTYEVQAAIDSGFSTVVAQFYTGSNRMSFLVTPGLEIWFRVRAVDAHGNVSDWSTSDSGEASVWLAEAPADPADDGKVLTANGGVGEWTTPAAGGGAAQLGVAKPSGGTQGYGIPGLVFTTSSTGSLGANTDRYCPFFVNADITLTELHFRVTTGPASDATVYLGIYDADDELQPTNLVYAGSVAVATGFTGQKSVTGLTTSLPVGTYLMAINTTVDMTVRRWMSANNFLHSNLDDNFMQEGRVGRAAGAFTSSPSLWTLLAGSTGVAQLNYVAMRWTVD